MNHPHKKRTPTPFVFSSTHIYTFKKKHTQKITRGQGPRSERGHRHGARGAGAGEAHRDGGHGVIHSTSTASVRAATAAVSGDGVVDWGVGIWGLIAERRRRNAKAKKTKKYQEPNVL